MIKHKIEDVYYRNTCTSTEMSCADVWIYMHIRTCMKIHVYKYTVVYSYTNTHTMMCAYRNVYIHVHTYMYTNIHDYTHTNIHAMIRHVLCVHSYLRTCTPKTWGPTIRHAVHVYPHANDSSCHECTFCKCTSREYAHVHRKHGCPWFVI